MTAPSSSTQRLRVAHLNPRHANPFALEPDADTRRAIAAELGISELPRLGFHGELRAKGGDAWVLTGRLTARVVQPCVVTLKPVRTNLVEDVRREYSPHVHDPEAEEVEMPDETLEPLGQFIDLSAVMIEALSLALPDYPRAAGAEREGDLIEDDAPDTRRPFEGLDRLLGGGGRDGAE
ncbi:YceD family protein [Paracoccus salsus]|uniref:YceD family protein n=1 Tax=Paracoccus salsus TaxID=2911061 RepID=UPI001F1BE3DA|nr:DUF177 domain-containing protein [Paracoccus salsus]MCF3973741.1 DUF177 domain-containing protein [Paracoccus salsus]